MESLDFPLRAENCAQSGKPGAAAYARALGLPRVRVQWCLCSSSKIAQSGEQWQQRSESGSLISQSGKPGGAAHARALGLPRVESSVVPMLKL